MIYLDDIISIKEVYPSQMFDRSVIFKLKNNKKLVLNKKLLCPDFFKTIDQIDIKNRK